MASFLRKLQKSLQTIKARSSTTDQGIPTYFDVERYKHDPVLFAEEVLGVQLTEDQKQILRCFPGRVKVNSAHSVGKSYVAAVLAIWWYYTRDPGVVIITAPTRDHVETVLWAEIRMLLAKAKIPHVGKLAPKAAFLFHHDDHWIRGYTSRSGEAFQGRHRSSMLFLMDESEDVDAIYWTTTETMYQPGSDHGWFAIGNPITTSSQSYLEDLAEGTDGKPKWRLFTLSALEHPNIRNQLNGLPPVIPNAVTIPMVNQWVKDWTDPVSEEDRLPTDIEWPPRMVCPRCKGNSNGKETVLLSGLLAESASSSAASDIQHKERGGGSQREAAEAIDQIRSIRDESTSDGFVSVLPVHGGMVPGGNGEVGAGCEEPGTSCALCQGLGFIGGGKYVRPGPQFKARVLGIRPTEGVDTVWSELAWLRAIQPKYTYQHCWTHRYGITIGVDTALTGSDDTCLHVRSGPLSLHHESHNGWLQDKTASRVKELCEIWTHHYNSWAVVPTAPKWTPDQVKVHIELDGPGYGVMSHCDNFGDWKGICVSEACDEYDSTGRPIYVNKRSAMWFHGRKKAMLSEMDLSKLPQDTLKKLKLQLLAPSYKQEGNGALSVEKKDKVKERLSRSPDDGDALLICYYEVNRDLPQVVTAKGEDMGHTYHAGEYAYLNGFTGRHPNGNGKR